MLFAHDSVQPFRTHNKGTRTEVHMFEICGNIYSLRVMYVCACVCVYVFDECCLISTIDSFNPALGGMCVCLDYFFFISSWYSFILLLFPFIVLSKYSQSYCFITDAQCFDKLILQSFLNGTNDWDNKKCEILLNLLQHIRVYIKGGKMVSTYELRTSSFNLHSIEFLKLVFGGFHSILEFKIFCNKNHLVWLNWRLRHTSMRQQSNREIFSIENREFQ